MSEITVDLPAPQSDAERSEARKYGDWLNPTRLPDAEWRGTRPADWDPFPEFAPTLAPDSPLLDPLLSLSRALWIGEPATITLPLEVDGADRPGVEFIVHHVNPADNMRTLQDTGVGAALADIYYHAKAALRGTTASCIRAGELASDELWNLGVVCFQPRSDDGGGCLASLYEDALIEGQDKGDEIAAAREKFGRLVKGAERAMDLADRVLIEGRQR